MENLERLVEQSQNNRIRGETINALREEMLTSLNGKTITPAPGHRFTVYNDKATKKKTGDIIRIGTNVTVIGVEKLWENSSDSPVRIKIQYKKNGETKEGYIYSQMKSGKAIFKIVPKDISKIPTIGTKEIDGLKTALEARTEELEKLKIKVKTLEEKGHTLDAIIPALNSFANLLKIKTESKTPQQILEEIKTKIQELQRSLEQKGGESGDFARLRTQIDGLTQEKTNLEGKITGLEETLKQKEATIEHLTKVNTLLGIISSWKGTKDELTVKVKNEEDYKNLPGDYQKQVDSALEQFQEKSENRLSRYGDIIVISEGNPIEYTILSRIDGKKVLLSFEEGAKVKDVEKVGDILRITTDKGFGFIDILSGRPIPFDNQENGKVKLLQETKGFSTTNTIYTAISEGIGKEVLIFLDVQKGINNGYQEFLIETDKQFFEAPFKVVSITSDGIKTYYTIYNPTTHSLLEISEKTIFSNIEQQGEEIIVTLTGPSLTTVKVNQKGEIIEEKTPKEKLEEQGYKFEQEKRDVVVFSKTSNQDDFDSESEDITTYHFFKKDLSEEFFVSPNNWDPVSKPELHEVQNTVFAIVKKGEDFVVLSVTDGTVILEGLKPKPTFTGNEIHVGNKKYTLKGTEITETVEQRLEKQRYTILKTIKDTLLVSFTDPDDNETTYHFIDKISGEINKIDGFDFLITNLPILKDFQSEVFAYFQEINGKYTIINITQKKVVLNGLSDKPEFTANEIHIGDKKYTLDGQAIIIPTQPKTTTELLHNQGFTLIKEIEGIIVGKQGDTIACFKRNGDTLNTIQSTVEKLGENIEKITVDQKIFFFETKANMLYEHIGSKETKDKTKTYYAVKKDGEFFIISQESGEDAIFETEIQKLSSRFNIPLVSNGNRFIYTQESGVWGIIVIANGKLVNVLNGIKSQQKIGNDFYILYSVDGETKGIGNSAFEQLKSNNVKTFFSLPEVISTDTLKVEQIGKTHYYKVITGNTISIFDTQKGDFVKYADKISITSDQIIGEAVAIGGEKYTLNGDLIQEKTEVTQEPIFDKNGIKIIKKGETYFSIFDGKEVECERVGDILIIPKSDKTFSFLDLLDLKDKANIWSNDSGNNSFSLVNIQTPTTTQIKIYKDTDGFPFGIVDGKIVTPEAVTGQDKKFRFTNIQEKNYILDLSNENNPTLTAE